MGLLIDPCMLGGGEGGAASACGGLLLVAPYPILKEEKPKTKFSTSLHVMMIGRERERERERCALPGQV